MAGNDISADRAAPAPEPVWPEAGASRGGVRFTSNIVGPMLFVRDLFCFLVSAPLAYLAYDALFGQRVEPSVHIFALCATIACFFTVRSSKQAYERSLVNYMDQAEDSLFDAVLSGLVATALVFLTGMVQNFSRGVSVLFMTILVTLLMLSRPFFRAFLNRLARRGLIGQRIAFYGADPVSVRAIRHLLETLRLPHLRFVGVADERVRSAGLEGLPMLGDQHALAQMARRGEIDQVLIGMPNLKSERLQQIMEELSAVSVDVSVIPLEAIELAPDYRVSLLGTVPVLTLWQRPFRDISGYLKRAEDLILGGIAILLVSPILALVALAVRLTSPGPILFVQPRVGFNNEVIKVYKFRTMYSDQGDLKGLETTTKNDPRVTPVGRVLRKLSIDELPQLFNVLLGDMSLVGPRPHATHMKVGDRFYQDAVKGYAGRHRVKPGITGLAQVKGLRGEIRTVERAKRRVELDKEYIDRWSVGLDLWILLLTVRAVFFDSDAY